MAVIHINLPVIGVDFGGGDVDFFVALDPVRFDVDNRPIANVAFRDELLQTKINETIDLVNTNETDVATNVADIAALDARIGILESWRAVTADVMLADHEARITALEAGSGTPSLCFEMEGVLGKMAHLILHITTGPSFAVLTNSGSTYDASISAMYYEPQTRRFQSFPSVPFRSDRVSVSVQSALSRKTDYYWRACVFDPATGEHSPWAAGVMHF